MLESVAVHGHGIAACCCTALLRKRGLGVSFKAPQTTSGPTLLVNTITQKLIADVFETHEDLFSNLPVIRKRIVLWGSAPTPTVLPHFGLVLSETALLQKLWPRVEDLCSSSPESGAWSIYSTPRHTNGLQQHFGSRIATALAVQLKEANTDSCFTESVDGGWLFLIPCGGRTGSLIAVGGSPPSLLEQSRLVSQQVESVIGSGATFPAYPRVLDPLCANGWLACGSGAMGFDPICGEGAGNAVREAILASAVIGSVANGGDPDRALAHYSTRLLSGFLRHLNVCREFYISARRSEWWDSELAQLERGIEWTRHRLSALPTPRYRLADFDLERIRQP